MGYLEWDVRDLVLLDEQREVLRLLLEIRRRQEAGEPGPSEPPERQGPH